MASCVNNSDLILFSLVALTFRGSWLCVCLHLSTLKPSSTAGRLLHWLSYVENVKRVRQKVDVSNFSCQLKQSCFSVDASRPIATRQPDGLLLK